MATIERTKNASRNIVFGMFLKTYQILLPFLMRTAMLYLMGVQYLGLNSLFTSVLQVLNLAELGVGSAMVFSMYKPIAEDDTTTICALMKLYKRYYRIIGLIIAVIGGCLTPFIPYLIKGDAPADINVYILYLLNLAATVLSYWLFAYKNSILDAHQRNDVASKVTLVTITIQYGLQLLVLWLFKNYYVYVIVALFTQALTNISTAVIADKLYPDFKAKGILPKEDVKAINKRIIDLFTAKIGYTVVNSADTIVISSFLGLTVLAEYQNYYFIMTSVIGFLTIILSSCTAGIGNSLVTDSLEKNYCDFRKLSLFITWVAGICVCCFLILYQPFMILWAGKEYLLPYSCVILMCIYFYLYITNHLMATYKDAAGMWHEDRFRPLCSALVNLTLNLLLVKYIGLFAIILSTILSYALVCIPWLIHNLFTVVFKRKKIEFVLSYLKNAVVVTFVAAINYVLCLWLPETGIISIAVRLLISIVVSNLLFVFFFGHGEDYIGMLQIIDKVTKHKFYGVIRKLERRA